MRRLLAAVGAAALGLALSLRSLWRSSGRRQQSMQFWTLVDYDQNGRTTTRRRPTTAPRCAPTTRVQCRPPTATARSTASRAGTSCSVPSTAVNPRPATKNSPRMTTGTPTPVYINCPWDTTRATTTPCPASTIAPTPRTKFKRTWQSQTSVHRSTASTRSRSPPATPVKPVACSPAVGPDPGQRRTRPLPERLEPAAVAGGVGRQRRGRTGRREQLPSTRRPTGSTSPGRRNPEPDVSYTVQEKVGDGKWASGAEVPGNATRYERAIEQPGKYQYRGAGRSGPLPPTAPRRQGPTSWPPRRSTSPR